MNGGTAWVYNLGDASVSQVDISTQSVRRSIPISTVPVTAAYYAGPLLAANSAGAWLVGVRRDGTGGAHTHWRRRRQARVRPGRRACRRRGKRERRLGARLWRAAWLSVLLGSGAQPTSPLQEGHRPSRVADERARCGSGATSVVRLGLRHRSRSAVGLALGYGLSELVRIDARTNRITGIAELGAGAEGPGVVERPPPPAARCGSMRPRKAGASSGSIARRSASPEKSARSRAGPDLRATPQARSGGTIPSRESSTVRPRHRKILSSIRVAPESTRRSRFHSSTITTSADSVWATVTPAFLP